MKAIGKRKDGTVIKFASVDSDMFCDNSNLLSLELPSGIKKVYCYNNKLSKLTLPKGVEFVDCACNKISELTLPEGIKSVDVYHNKISELTLPNGVEFVDCACNKISELKIPESVERLFCYDNPDLTHVIRGGVNLRVMYINGFTMIILSEKKRGKHLLFKAKFWGAGPLEDLKSCYVAGSDGYYSHGKTARKAIHDLGFKIHQETVDVSDLAAEIKARGKLTRNEYRLLTGACHAGVTHFLSEQGLGRKRVMKIEDALKITKGAYGGTRLQELLG